MATRDISPQANNEGSIGTALKNWASGWIKLLTVLTINKLTITQPATGATLTIADGKTLTATQNTALDEAVAMSSKAPKASPVFTGDVTLAGKVTNTTLPAFLAFNSVTDANQTGAGAIVVVDFDTEVFDLGNNFAADVFTAPVTGKYHFDVQVNLYPITSAMTAFYLRLVTTNRTYTHEEYAASFPANSGKTFSLSVLADIEAGETVQVSVQLLNGAGNTAGIIGHATILFTYFSGHLVS